MAHPVEDHSCGCAGVACRSADFDHPAGRHRRAARGHARSGRLLDAGAGLRARCSDHHHHDHAPADHRRIFVADVGRAGESG